MTCSRCAATYGQHIKEVSCQGDLIAIFTQAELFCCQNQDDVAYDDLGFGCLNGHVCLFSLTAQEPIHVIDCPSWFGSDLSYCSIMRYKWSPNSKLLMVYWRDDMHMELQIACLSQDALAERQVWLSMSLSQGLHGHGNLS